MPPINSTVSWIWPPETKQGRTGKPILPWKFPELYDFFELNSLALTLQLLFWTVVLEAVVLETNYEFSVSFGVPETDHNGCGIRALWLTQNTLAGHMPLLSMRIISP